MTTKDSTLKSDNDKISFEVAMAQLEEIVGKLESGDITLDESMSLFTEGMRLSKICNAKIEEIEHKITMLVSDEKGGLHEVEFDN
jgi:exodeoxyribonuclease VII small subunit